MTDRLVPVADQLGRPLRDLRVSVTDRCNFRCVYCMPREAFGPDHAFLEREDLLTFEEIARVVRVATRLGVQKVRLTGGEPLVRRDLPDLVEMLSRIDDVEDLALTTNGSLLAGLAEPLRQAGLDRLTVSLDALDDATFREMADVKMPVSRVLDGIEAARAAGFETIKLNAVIRRGVNEHAVLDLVEYARGTGDIVRFVEYMDVGMTNGWQSEDVVPADEILSAIEAVHPIEPLAPRYPGEVVRRYRYADGAGEVGVITSVTRPFCRSCTRGRLSPIGEVFTCLFAGEGTGLKPLLRGGGSDDDLEALLRAVWMKRTDRYSELRATGADTDARVEMSYIGG